MHKIFNILIAISFILFSTNSFSGWLTGGYYGHQKQKKMEAAKADGWKINDKSATHKSSISSKDGQSTFSMECNDDFKLFVKLTFPSEPIEFGVAKLTYSNGIVVKAPVHNITDKEYNVASEKDAAIIFNRNRFQENVNISLLDNNGKIVNQGKTYNLVKFVDALTEQCTSAAGIRYRSLVSKESSPYVFDEED
ncbi:MAG: hypothetical protein V3U75_09205 [Methylococcaceae bacterium]